MAAPPEASLLDPVHSMGVKDFNIWYFLIGIVGTWFCVASYMEGQGFNASAKSAHEYRMGRVLSQWRWIALCLFFMVVVLTSYTYMNHPAYADKAAEINSVLDNIAENDPTIGQDNSAAMRKQLTVTVALTRI